MSMASKLQSPVKPVSEVRPVLGRTGNRVTRVSVENKGKTEALKKPPPRPRKPAASETAEMAVKNNLSVDSSCSTDSSSSSSSSSSSGSSVKVATSSARIVKRKGFRHSKAIPDGGQEVSPEQKGPVKRCDWITPNSDPIYTSFHDEEWGVPVRDDQKLFELLVFSQALAELSWPAILHMRDIFKELFDNFDPSSVAQFTEKKLLSLKVNGNLLLSEPKLRAIMVNAQQVLKIQQEFGSFSNYCWRFVNHKALRNGFRYARQVPVKTPKAETISKDLMQRGFRCVGPTIVYSFMQVTGIVNDHLTTCFRYQECNDNVKEEALKSKIEETKVVCELLEHTRLSKD